MTKETKRTSSSNRATTTRMELATQGIKTAVTRRDPHWKKCEWFLLPLPQVDWSWPQTISVPIHMLPIPTPDQAHHSHKAAWDTQLPPSNLHSTHIRHIGTELRWNVVNALLLLMLQDWPCSSQWEPGMGVGMYCSTTYSKMSGSRVPPFSQIGVVASKLYLFWS